MCVYHVGPESVIRSFATRSSGSIVVLAFALIIAVGCGGVGGSKKTTPTPAQPLATLYVNNATAANTVSAYQVAAGGTLTPVGGSPFSTAGAGGPGDSIVVSGNGQWVFASNCGSDTIAAFAVASTGALAPIPGSPFPIGAPGFSGCSMTLSAHDQFLFVGRSSRTEGTPGNIVAFAVAANGGLTPVPGSPFAFGWGDTLAMKVLPNDSFLFATGISSGKPPNLGMQAFRVGANGSLTQTAVMPFSSNLLDANCASTVLFVGPQPFNIASDGTLTEAQPALSLIDDPAPTAMVLSPNERFLFLANGFNPTAQAFNPSTSTLAVGSDYFLQTLPGNPWFPLNTAPNVSAHAMTIDRSGTFVFTASLTPAGQVIDVQRVAADGTLTLAPGSPLTINPEQTQHSIAVLPRKQCQ